MNPYLRAVGFGGVITDRQLDALAREVIRDPDETYVMGKAEHELHLEYYKKFGRNFGLVVRGTMDELENVQITECQPYALSRERMTANRTVAGRYKGSLLAYTEEESTGNELVFEITNSIDFHDTGECEEYRKLNLAGLSLSGTVLLPLATDEESLEVRREEEMLRREILVRARAGDPDAVDELDQQEQDAIDTVRERLKTEDFFSIVDGFFIPSDERENAYTLLGQIVELRKPFNTATKELVYRLTLSVTGSRLDVYINARDLVGHPTVGMRFFGLCQLVGKILF